MNQIKLFWQRLSSQQGKQAAKTAYAETVLIVGLIGTIIAAWKAKNISLLGANLQQLFEGLGTLGVAARLLLSSNDKVAGAPNGTVPNSGTPSAPPQPINPAPYS